MSIPGTRELPPDPRNAPPEGVSVKAVQRVARVVVVSAAELQNRLTR
jgi:hypothetical protein